MVLRTYPGGIFALSGLHTLKKLALVVPALDGRTTRAISKRGLWRVGVSALQFLLVND